MILDFSKAQLRLAKFIENAGTLFLASHSEALLRQFCTRGLVFEHGKIIFDGDLDLALSFTMNKTINSIIYGFTSRKAWWFTATAKTKERFARTTLGSFWLGCQTYFQS